MMRTIFAVSLAAIVLGGSLLPAQEPEKKPKSLMAYKLEYSQKILEGLTTEDFELVARNAKAMKGVTQLEQWFKADSPGYKTQLQVFRFANEELIRLSEEENIDGAALAYMQATLSCVNCHRYIRDASK